MFLTQYWHNWNPSRSFFSNSLREASGFFLKGEGPVKQGDWTSQPPVTFKLLESLGKSSEALHCFNQPPQLSCNFDQLFTSSWLCFCLYFQAEQHMWSEQVALIAKYISKRLLKAGPSHAARKQKEVMLPMLLLALPCWYGIYRSSFVFVF